MMPLERRNEPQMLRQFSKMYPSYNLNPLLRRRHRQLVEAQAFNAWLSNRRLQQECMAVLCEMKLNLQLAKREGSPEAEIRVIPVAYEEELEDEDGQEILRLLGRRWTRPQRVLVRYDPLTHTVLSYLCEVIQRASERSYLGKRGLKTNARQPLRGGD